MHLERSEVGSGRVQRTPAILPVLLSVASSDPLIPTIKD